MALRTLRHEEAVYLWRVHHRHGVDSAAEPRRCTEVFTAFRQGFRGSPLRILFPETEQQGPGFPAERGVIHDRRAPAWRLNLNRPRVARLLIELGLQSGWEPAGRRREHLVPDGYAFLRQHRSALDLLLREGDPP